MPLENIRKEGKKVICITGPAGSGKSTLSEYLKSKGYSVINVDKLGHKALEIAKPELVKEFGDILGKTGCVSREKLKQKLVSQKEWEKLEEITHPVIRKLLREDIKKQKGEKVIVDVAIPYTLGLESLCTVIIRIESPEDALRERLAKRGMSGEFINKILEKQEKETGRVDYTIENNGNIDEFVKKGLLLIEKI